MVYLYKYQKYKNKLYNLTGGTEIKETKTVSVAPPNHHVPLTIGSDGEHWYLLGPDGSPGTIIDGHYPMIKDNNGTEIDYKHGSQVFVEPYHTSSGERRFRFME